MKNKRSSKERIFKGVGVTNGKVMGKLKFFADSAVSDFSHKGSVEEEKKSFEEAGKTALKQIKALEKKALLTLGEKEAQIFEIHAMLLEDEDFVSNIYNEIEKGESAKNAVSKTAKAYSEMLLSLDDEYLSARSADIGDIASLLIRILSGDERNEGTTENEPYILVAKDLTPSQTVSLEKGKILAFVTFGGTPSSHTAILARAMGIPALVGTGIIEKEMDGQLALLNAENGSLVICPTREEIARFERERQAYNKIAKEHELYLRSIMNKPAVTRSGHKIMIYANIGNESEVASALSNGAEGIGLLRSEFLYLEASTYPDEEELFSAYRDIAIKMQGKRVVIRTLDIGADKKIPYFDLPNEENPALGYRAVRICLDRQELFKIQLRAILRASSFGTISIMIPMIISVAEVKKCKSILEECKSQLEKEGIPFDSKIEFGIMIETPASAIMSEELSAEVDFFSVGTNDLTQYTLAVDRQNSKVSSLAEGNSEPVLRLIKMAADAIHQKGGWIGVCGEMAADLSMTQQLVNMGIDELSVSVPYLLGVRGKISECR